MSTFVFEDGVVYHSYFAYARGLDSHGEYRLRNQDALKSTAWPDCFDAALAPRLPIQDVRCHGSGRAEERAKTPLIAPLGQEAAGAYRGAIIAYAAADA